MIHLAVGLIHNKTGNGNRNQINTLVPLIVRHIETGIDPDTQEGDTGRIWYTLSDLNTEHEVKFFQVIPFGVNPPNNLYSLDSWKVFYGQGDEDKVGEHSRFFNWLVKRGTDHGADVVLYVRFPNLFGAVDLDTTLSRLTTRRVFIERAWGKAFSVILLRRLRENRQETLREDLPFDDALLDLRARIIALGLEYE